MSEQSQAAGTVKLMLGGDVMTGRGIDQALPHPCDPVLYEPYVKSARHYLLAAERVSGPVPRAADYDYIWGDELERCRRRKPDLRIVNLETSVTTSPDAADKGIHYRMHPENVDVLTAAGIDCCTLANNHVLDWGRAGLEETLRTLAQSGLRYAGAGYDLETAEAPAILSAGSPGRVLVFSFATPSSGAPPSWAAQPERPGIAVLEELTREVADRIAARVRAIRKPGDIAVVSIHWGGNWGYGVPDEQQAFARRLIDAGGADIVHGHSSHHAKAIEAYREKLILYGCGDLINDYEGIRGHEEYRSELPLLYFASVRSADGRLAELEMVPFEIRRFRLNDVSDSDLQWIKARMEREYRRFGGGVTATPTGALRLDWRKEG